METNFWLERWAKHEIGFHQGRVNEYLTEYWPQLGIANDATVFVPLCGKTLDMRWLAQCGHNVLGVEIARNACEEFFAEWGVVPSVTQQGNFERWTAQGVTLLCGDFFDLQAAHLACVRGVFDRAALIALPPSLRARYATTLRALLATNTSILLVAPDYDQHQMKGPPFAVAPTEIESLFAGCRVELLRATDVTDLPEHARFRQRGLTKLVERVFLIESQPSA